MTKSNDTIYLDGKIIKTAVGSMHCNTTQVIALVSSFCQPLPISICIVLPDNENPPQKFSNLPYSTLQNCLKSGFVIPENLFSNISVISKLHVPDIVAACSLPVVLKSCESYLICGLCHIIRYLIKESAKQDAAILKLLGYKYCCLKSSSEVSSRTHLCEVAATDCTDSKLTDLQTGNSLPDVISKFENLLRSPINIHNMDKHQRVILGVLDNLRGNQNKNNNQATGDPSTKVKKRVVDTKDLPPLVHVFADGVDFMVSDIALIPCIHHFLALSTHLDVLDFAQVPSILSWYKRIQNMPGVWNGFELCNMKLLDVNSPSEGNMLPNVNCSDGNYSFLEYKPEKDIKKSKPVKPLTIRRDLSTVLDKTGELVQYLQYEEEQIKLCWNELPVQVHPTTGELTSTRAVRKCQQIENIIRAVKDLCVNGETIVEFCCGGGHVGIVLAYLLPHCKVVLLDNKEESLTRAHNRVRDLKLDNVVIYQCNLDHYKAKFDIGVALHACGVATDMVLHTCLTSLSSFVISPCCYGKICNTDVITYPQSQGMKDRRISYDELLLLAQAGDQTCWDFASDKAKKGKQCMGLVDLDRMTSAEERGYSTKMMTMQPADCSPKHNLIVGLSTARRRPCARLT